MPQLSPEVTNLHHPRIDRFRRKYYERLSRLAAAVVTLLVGCSLTESNTVSHDESGVAAATLEPIVETAFDEIDENLQLVIEATANAEEAAHSALTATTPEQAEQQARRARDEMARALQAAERVEAEAREIISQRDQGEPVTPEAAAQANQALEVVNILRAQAEEAARHADAAVDRLPTPTPTPEPLDREALLEEWDETQYVDLTELSEQEVVERLEVLQPTLPREYRDLLPVGGLAEVYTFYHQQAANNQAQAEAETTEVVGFNLEAMALEFDDGSVWLPGLGAEFGDYIEGGRVYETDRMVEPEHGTTIIIYTADDFKFNFRVNDGSVRGSALDREAVPAEVIIGPFFTENFEVIWQSMYEVWPNIKGNTLIIAVMDKDLSDQRDLTNGMRSYLGLSSNGVSLYGHSERNEDSSSNEIVYVRVSMPRHMARGSRIGNQGGPVERAFYHALDVVENDNPALRFDYDLTSAYQAAARDYELGITVPDVSEEIGRYLLITVVPVEE